MAEEPAAGEPARPRSPIRIAPDATCSAGPSIPRMVFDALKGLGAIEMTCDTSAVPSLPELDPFDCHLAWT